MQVADAEGAGGPAPPPPPGRKLRSGEMELARSIFGDRINYACVRVHRRKAIPPNIFGNQKDTEIVTPNGELYYPEDNSLYRPDFSTTDSDTDHCAQETFIHEMTHVLQFQAGKSVAGRALLHRDDRFYGYELDQKKRFRDYRLEQQATIIEDYFRIRRGYAPINLGPGEKRGNCHSTKLTADQKQTLLGQYESLLQVDKHGHITAPVGEDDTGQAPAKCGGSHGVDTTAKPDDPGTLPGDIPRSENGSP